MFKSIVCSILLITIATSSAVPKTPNDIAVKLTAVNDASQLKTLKEQGIELVSFRDNRDTCKITYYMGSHVPNEQLVAQSSNNYTFGTPQDVEVRFEYPKNGEGAIITYTEIALNQCTFNGSATFVSGGIGQRSIVVIIEAYNTLEFNYATKVYGI